jgi:hypothetical protein
MVRPLGVLAFLLAAASSRNGFFCMYSYMVLICFIHKKYIKKKRKEGSHFVDFPKHYEVDMGFCVTNHTVREDYYEHSLQDFSFS